MTVSLPLAFGWRHLLFANWSIDADRLDSHLPDALSVQTYDGVGWLTVVPFVNVDTRPRVDRVRRPRTQPADVRHPRG